VHLLQLEPVGFTIDFESYSAYRGNDSDGLRPGSVRLALIPNHPCWTDARRSSLGGKVTRVGADVE
jgi:hypothetical protein